MFTFSLLTNGEVRNAAAEIIGHKGKKVDRCQVTISPAWQAGIIYK